ncbi:MAG: MFS transporter, partial [Planctomycetes bacterium]|nr:MFS transporter [Planctomycetota bacterium]
MKPPITSALLAVWALFVGLGVMLAGHGLQSTLVGVRATLEAFPAATIGVIMTGFYIGYVVGARLAPRLVQSVGHVRTFG